MVRTCGEDGVEEFSSDSEDSDVLGNEIDKKEMVEDGHKKDEIEVDGKIDAAEKGFIFVH